MSKGQCLIIGAGVNGLSSAVRLLEDGWGVTIWSSKFSPNTTSDVAAALWYPFLSAPVEKTHVWGSKTYDVLKDLSLEKETGISMMQTYEYFRTSQPDPSWMNVVDNFERLTGDLPTDYVECFSFVTSIIEMPIYMTWLRSRCDKLGAKIIQKEVKNLKQFPLNFKALINCTGLDSKKLLDDDNMYPIRGQIISVRADVKEMYLDQQHETLTYIVPRKNDVILGGVAQENNWNLDPDEADQKNILNKCGSIIPDLRDAEIIKDAVGLRPGRTEVRLEKEMLGNRLLVHNYGHGGSGVTLSWGCADDVVELVNA